MAAQRTPLKGVAEHSGETTERDGGERHYDGAELAQRRGVSALRHGRDSHVGPVFFLFCFLWLPKALRAQLSNFGIQEGLG